MLIMQMPNSIMAKSSVAWLKTSNVRVFYGDEEMHLKHDFN